MRHVVGWCRLSAKITMTIHDQHGTWTDNLYLYLTVFLSRSTGGENCKNLRKAMSNGISIFRPRYETRVPLPLSCKKASNSVVGGLIDDTGNRAGLFLKRQCQPLPTMANFHSHPQKSKAQRFQIDIKKNSHQKHLFHKINLHVQIKMLSTSNPFSIKPFPPSTSHPTPRHSVLTGRFSHLQLTTIQGRQGLSEKDMSKSLYGTSPCWCWDVGVSKKLGYPKFDGL